MNRRSSRSQLSAVGLAALLIAGSCAPSDPTGVVRFWGFGREGDVVRELVPEFERRNPGLHVIVQQVPWTAAHEKLLTGYVGRATPDVAQLGNTWIPEFVALRALAPLGDRLGASEAIDRSDYFEGIWDTNVVDGATWGVPWYVDTRVIFYRTDLVAQSGAPWPPRTWDEWRQAMEAIKRHSQGRDYAILLPIDEWDKPVLLGMEAGSEILRDGGRHGAFADDGFRKAADFYLDLYAAELAPPLANTGVANLYQQFEQGYFAMVVTGPWNLGEFKARLPAALQDRWSTAPLPAVDAAHSYPGVSLAGGSSLVMFRQARDPDAAWRFIEYLSEPRQQARFHEISGNLPARRSAWDLTALATDPRAAAFRSQLAAVRATPKVPEWERIATRVAERCEEVMRGKLSLDAALVGLDRDAETILAKRRWILDRTAAGGSS